jgi:hypothetical protein
MAAWTGNGGSESRPLAVGIGGGSLFHFTNDKGYKAISSQVVWLFRASKPPGGHLKGAYFTTLPPGTKNLNKFGSSD